MTDVAATDEWFTREGERYAGDVFQDDKGKAFGEATSACGRCGGSGRWRRGRARGDCFACEGAGERFEQVRLFTGPEIERLDQQRTKRAAAKDAAERERALLREVAAAEFRRGQAELISRAELRRSNAFVASLLSKIDQWGGLTEAQTEALGKALDRMDEDERLFARSEHLFSVGERVDVEVECRSVGSFLAKKFKGRGTEEVFVTEMIDPNGNALIAVTPNFTLRQGERALVRGTVKGHDDRRGWPSTVLTRLKVIEFLAEADPESMPSPRM